MDLERIAEGSSLAARQGCVQGIAVSCVLCTSVDSEIVPGFPRRAQFARR